MIKITVSKDLEEAKRLWQRHWPRTCLFDLWPVRSCFQKQFNHQPYFITATRNDEFQGLAALSWIDEQQYFGYFPGEIWQGKTWLEQNKLIAVDSDAAEALIENIPTPATLRYLAGDPMQCDEDSLIPHEIDEIGYLFYPGQHNHSFQNYLNCFSSRSRKKMRQEADRLTVTGLSYRYNHLPDIEEMFRLNIDSYKDYSYFNDLRFLRSFESLAAWLHANGLLRITTVLIGGCIAAVDLGAVWNSTYTILAGGTHSNFPGVAKLINFHHIEWSCMQKFTSTDFLCGEFNWKDRFHLTPRPLYKIIRRQPQKLFQSQDSKQGIACEC